MKNKKIIYLFPILLFLILTNKDYILLGNEIKIINIKEDIENKPSIKNEEDIELKYLIGKFNYKNDPNFILVDNKFCREQMKLRIYLRKEVYIKFKEMHADALKSGVNLLIYSGTRNFDEQKSIWERKWELNFNKLKDSVKTAKKILLFSSMPCTSRHHWGTDLDLINLNNNYFETGQGLKEYKWLKENGSKFGFCQVYDDKSITKRTGYELERWHWSYMPTSSKFLIQYIKKVNYNNINNFKGHHLASNKEINMIDNFVKGINSKCN